MNNATVGLKHIELTEKVIQAFYAVYNEMGSGFLESCYDGAMELALVEAGLKVQRQVPIEVWFRGRKVGFFSADRATRLEVGLLLNFGPKPEFKRLAFDNERKAGVVAVKASPTQSTT